MSLEDVDVDDILGVLEGLGEVVGGTPPEPVLRTDGVGEVGFGVRSPRRWGELVADLRFPFGQRAVPGKFHEITAALVRFMRAQGFSAKVGFLDGFWVCTKLETGPRGALEALRLLQDVLEFLGLEAAWEKCEGPVQDVIFLDQEMRELEDGVAYFGLDAVARDTRSSHDTGAKKQACFPQSGIMLRGGVKFIGKDQMEVAAGFSKTNQFAEGEHKVLFNAVRYPAFCAVTLTGGALASNKLPRGPKAPVLSYRKSDGQQEMTQEQRSAIPRLVADSMEAAVDACC
ncbi:hypothetical protein CYMTET_42324 [Cymbomonas tetramitiformis]|uniref:Uncharacterized protein n=1 Tax=Cymbomonas tetramitiformis TaxID=36881 RepID=A0AAE0C6B0_9CHLO|nr:hypothetical protein CYMTET_42324 [Cymbomonas tetramitiformis]